MLTTHSDSLRNFVCFLIQIIDTEGIVRFFQYNLNCLNNIGKKHIRSTFCKNQNAFAHGLQGCVILSISCGNNTYIYACLISVSLHKLSDQMQSCDILDADLTTELLLAWRKGRMPEEVKAFLEIGLPQSHWL